MINSFLDLQVSQDDDETGRNKIQVSFPISSSMIFYIAMVVTCYFKGTVQRDLRGVKSGINQ
jgi:hypothetical protein